MGCTSSSGGHLNSYVTIPEITKTYNGYDCSETKVIRKRSVTKVSCAFRSDPPMAYGSRYLAYYNVVLLDSIDYPQGTLTKGTRYGTIVRDTLSEDYLITTVDHVPLYLISHSGKSNSMLAINPTSLFGTFPTRLLVKSPETMAVTTERA